jgi:hypothetical protein
MKGRPAEKAFSAGLPSNLKSEKSFATGGLFTFYRFLFIIKMPKWHTKIIYYKVIMPKWHG